MGAVRALLLAAAVAVLSVPAAAQSGLGGQALEPLATAPDPAPGECVLLLWSRNAGQRDRELVAVVVGGRTNAVATVKLAGRERRVARASQDMERYPGLFERQRFVGEGLAVDIRVNFVPGRGPGEDALLRSGLVKVRGRQGWETIAPVAGGASCAPG